MDNIFESKSIPKAYFTLALPTVFSLVITIIYNITDTYFIALTRDTNLVAGISLCAPIFTLLMGFGNIFGGGGSSLLSRLMGQNDTENLHRAGSFCFYTSIIFGLIAAVLMILFRVPLLRLLGADNDTLQYALPYYTWFSAGAPFVLLSFVHPNLLRSEGMARESMVSTVGGSLVNIVLDPILIFTCGLGAAGAAIATILGYAFTDLYCIYIVRKKSRVLCLDPRMRHLNKAHSCQIFSIGLSAALTNITQSFCLILTNQCLLSYGNDKIAAMGIVQKVSMVVMLVIVGFAFGGAPLIGYTFGSGNNERMKQLLSFVLKFLSAIALGMSLLLMLLAPTAMRAFLDDPELIRIGAVMLRAQLLGMVFMAFVQLMTIYFQSTGKALPALALALSRQGIIFAAVLFLAVAVAGYKGVVYTQAIADLLSAVLAFVLYLRVRDQEISRV